MTLFASPHKLEKLALRGGVAVVLALCAAMGARACQTCDNAAADPAAFGTLTAGDDLRIELETGFTFRRFAAGADAILEAPRSARTGTQLAGPPGLSGRILLTGIPHRLVSIDIPRQVRLSGPGRTDILVREVRLERSGPFRLGADGRLQVGFAGILDTPALPKPGEYRADLTVSADYL